MGLCCELTKWWAALWTFSRVGDVIHSQDPVVVKVRLFDPTVLERHFTPHRSAISTSILFHAQRVAVSPGLKVRTVVTGHNAEGRAVFVRDEKVDGTPIPGLGELAFLWNADEPATYPNAGNNPAAPVRCLRTRQWTPTRVS